MGQSSLAREERRRSFRESLDTLVLGAVSSSLGVMVLMVMGIGIGGIPARGFLDHTGVWGLTAAVGEMLGLAGLLLARKRHGVIAPLSLLGTLVCFSHFVIFPWVRP
jgi:hypothetical protein